MKTFFIWMQKDDGWKTMMALIYAVICIYDFIVVPVWFGLVRAQMPLTDLMVYLKDLDPSVQIRVLDAYTFQHDPFTLKGGGLFHLAFGALLTGSALSRTKQ
jgi:hypothetical protein